MGIARIAALLAAYARGQRVPQRDDPGSVLGEQHPGGVGASLTGGFVIIGKMLDNPLGDSGQVNMRRCDQAFRGRRQRPRGRRQLRIIFSGSQGDELIEHVREVVRPQIRLQYRQESASVHGPVPPQNGMCGLDRLPRRAVTRPD